MNKAKVDVGQSPPLDLVSAQAEVAADEEQLIIAETAVQAGRGSAAPAHLRSDATATRGTCRIEPVDSPPVGDASRSTSTPPSTRALGERADLLRARKDIDNAADRTSKFTGNQRLPDVRLNAELSGERPRRHAGPAHRRLSRHDRRARARSPTSGSVLEPARSRTTTRRGRSASASSYPLGQSSRRSQLRARASSNARRPTSA